jgi:hypothetical protein
MTGYLDCVALTMGERVRHAHESEFMKQSSRIVSISDALITRREKQSIREMLGERQHH